MRKVLLLSVAGLMLCALTGAVLIILPKPLRGGGDLEVVIPSGISSREVARTLKESDLIYSRWLFAGYARLSGADRRFKSGTYRISLPASSREISRLLVEGDALSDDISVTVPEGTNLADLDKILSRAGLTQAGAFLADLSAEGYLFPDTYRFRPRTPAGDISVRMRQTFTEKTGPLLAGLTLQEIRDTVILASILEKEVRTEQDMRLVAGILKRRMRLGMLLQVDATVSYGVCHPKFLKREYCDVSQANIVDNLSSDSGYNTYRRKGLPAGPVSNPGIRAVRAALLPLESDYLYYLSARDGTTIFSETAAGHLAARKKHLGY